MNKAICEMVTDKILAQMKNGTIPWLKPWKGGAPISHATGKRYSLLNRLMLDKPGEYITFKQAQAEGGTVKKGEKGYPIVFWKMNVIEEVDKDTGEKTLKRVPTLRYYTVFHISQCDGIEPKYEKPLEHHADPDGTAEEIVTRYGKEVQIFRNEPSGSAYYSPMLDIIRVPMIEQYESTAEYYSTLFHEMVHSTGHKSRLGRFGTGASNAAFGSEDYSKEELVAEIGAATLVSYCGLESESSIRNSTAYVQNWMNAIADDPTLVIAASGKAEKAVDYILDEDEEEEE